MLVGDAFHNFVDGVVIAATFAVSIPTGIATTLAVLAHENHVLAIACASFIYIAVADLIPDMTDKGAR